jgi:glycine cleavage system H lipoate-binding protein
MLAGVINYKLCDFEFLCENCVFDKVMHGKLPPQYLNAEITNEFENIDNLEDDYSTSSFINQYLYSLFSDCKINLDRYQHPSHLWFKIETDDISLVGIDKMLIKILQPIEKINVPKVGIKCQKGSIIIKIIRHDKILPIYSPVNCKITEINHQFSLNDFSQLVEKDAYYFKIEAKGLRDEIQKLCRDINGLQCLNYKIQMVRQYLETSFKQNHPFQMGITLADGGTVQKCLEKVIGKNLFQNLLTKLLWGVKKSEI